MEGTSDRRGFLRHLLGEVARGAQELAPAMPQLEATLAAAAPEAPARPARRIVAAAPAARCATDEDLTEQAVDCGLGERLDAVRALARRGVRLTPAPADATSRSRLGGDPDLPPGTTWPTWQGSPLTFLAQIDLAAAAAALGAAADLPPRGMLHAFYAAGASPSGLRLAHDGSAAVLLTDADPAEFVPRRSRRAAQRRAGRAVRLSAELSLPRVWSAPVQALGLDEREHDGWTALRRRLAETQGVTLADEAAAGDDLPALHRLLGYADGRRGDMALACEMAAQDVDLGEEPPNSHPRAGELEERATRWRLLLQLTADDALGWDWGGRHDRLHLLTDAPELRADAPVRVWAVPQ